MDVEAIVPQHGRMFKGKKMVNEFLNWIENLECGIDLMTQDNYRLPCSDIVDLELESSYA
jgi:flavorubredoxin